MFIKIKTANSQRFLIECQDGIYWIRETSSIYLKDKILGKKCSMPKIEMPLTIYLDNETTLSTSRIKEINKVDLKKKEL